MDEDVGRDPRIFEDSGRELSSGDGDSSVSDRGESDKIQLIHVKGSIFLKNRHSIIQERFKNINKIIKCGT